MSPRIFHIWAGIASVIALFAGTACVTFYNADICPDTSFNWWLNFVPSLGYVCLFGAAWWWSVGAFAFDPDAKLSDLFTGRHIFVLWLTSIGALCMGLLFFPSPASAGALATCQDNGQNFLLNAGAPFILAMFGTWAVLMILAIWFHSTVREKQV